MTLAPLVALAISFWGAPACGVPQVSTPELSPGVGGQAFQDECRIEVNSLILTDRRLVCEVVLHEVGHLRLGPAFAAENPSDPWHALSGPMSALGANTTVCRQWSLTVRKRPVKIHHMKRKKKKVQTAATGGSAVLLSARLQSGAGKHGVRRTPRAVDKRRSIEEQS